MSNSKITIGTRVTIPALPASSKKTGTVVALSTTYDYTDATVRWDDGTVDEIDTGWLYAEMNTLAMCRPHFAVVRTVGNEDGWVETDVMDVARTKRHAQATRARLSRQDDYEFSSYDVRVWNGRFYEKQPVVYPMPVQPVYDGEIPF